MACRIWTEAVQRLGDYRTLRSRDGAVCYLSPVTRRLIVLALIAAVVGCAKKSEQPDHQAEWRDVLQHKKAAVAPQAGTRQKQLYADSVSAFVRRHPNHSRAREVYQRIQLEFAEELASLGRYQDSIRFYRAVLAHDPQNKEARLGLAVALDRLAVSRDKLLQLEKGMSHKEVSDLLGKPIPGWTVKTRHRDVLTEAWYYRTTSGGLAGVYFREGRVFAAEENSEAKVGL